MNVELALKWMEKFNDKIQANKEYLSDLDTPIGDGDHGGNMSRGMLAVMENLDGKTFESAADVFKVVAMQLLSKVGGASGPLYGSAFMGIAKHADKNAIAMLKSGLEMIQKRGKAEVGEKTMVDVWANVIKNLEEKSLTVEKVKTLVESTKLLKATKGRASYVGERSINHIDPGSCSSGYLFEALLEVGGV